MMRQSFPPRQCFSRVEATRDKSRDTGLDKVFEKFNADKENTILRYKKLIPEIKKAWPAAVLRQAQDYGEVKDQNPLVGELEKQLQLLCNDRSKS